MEIPFVLCDVFTDRHFAGNQLAVFLRSDGLSDEHMLVLAREFGWSEVTFVGPGNGTGWPRIRIWTVDGELPFAGHPTIGTAVVLAAKGIISTGWSSLLLGIGPVAVDVTRADDSGGHATMTQRTPEFGLVFHDRARLAQSLGLSETDLVDDLPAQIVSTGIPHFMVPVRTLDALGRARPDAGLLPGVTAEVGARNAYLFCVDTMSSSAAARARLLGVGVDDPATGSAAGPLGAYLVRYGLHRAGTLDIEQGIEVGRPSRLAVDVPLEGGEIGSVRVSGEVRIWAQGSLMEDALSSYVRSP